MGQNLPYHPCPCSTVGSFFKPGRPLWESFVVAQTIRRFSSRIICFEKICRPAARFVTEAADHVGLRKALRLPIVNLGLKRFPKGEICP